VRHLHATLQERGFAVVALSGEHSQSERNQALQALRDRRARVCVATDVAARGIDLPSLSLVVHVEIPRDAETLQHRSGRTGRAGKKGTAVLIVPFPRRRRVESMLQHARINAEWIDAPSPDDIRAQDRTRLLSALLAPVEVDETDRELAEALLAERSPADIAAMLVRAHRASLPEPEELMENTPEARRAAQKERHRPGFEDAVWFRMNVGRRHNADPRWILPLLCRRGHITRNEIGAIRIAPNDPPSRGPPAAPAKSTAPRNRAAGGEGEGEGVFSERSKEPPREGARRNREHGRDNAAGSAGAYVRPRHPHKGNGPRQDREGGKPAPWKGKKKPFHAGKKDR